MSIAKSNIPHVGAALTVLFMLVGVFATPAHGQDQNASASNRSEDADEQKPQFSIEVDVQSLIQNDAIFVEALSDPVWQIEANPGRQLVRIPLIVQSDEQEIELRPNTVSMRSGRFVAYQIVEKTGPVATRRIGVRPARRGRGGRFRQFDRVRPRRTTSRGGSPDPDEPDFFDARPRRSRGFSGPQLSDASDAPKDAPRVTKRIMIRGGKISWSLDGKIASGTVKEGNNLYALRLDSKLLRSRAPQRPVRLKKRDRESAREFSQRRSTQNRKYSALKTQYKETQRAVTKLTTTFEAPRPPRFWAVFEAPESLRDLAIIGIEPEAWSIKLKDLTMLRTSGSGLRRAGPQEPDDPLDPDTLDVVEDMARLLGREPHPYDLRAVAYTLEQSVMVPLAKPLDPLYGLLQTVLRGSDVTARHVIVEQLVLTEPPTPASLNLLKLAARDPNAAIKLQALRGVLRAGTSNPSEVAQMLDEANQFISTSSTPEQVLEELMAVNEDLPETSSILVSRIYFDRLRGEQRDSAIKFVVTQAAMDPLAAGWLDHQLLGASNPKLVGRTLEVLDNAKSAHSVIEPLVHQLLDAWLGSIETTQPDEGVLLNDRIEIDSASHSLFRALESGDTRIRNLAWHCLRHFVIAPPLRRGRNRGNQATYSDPYNVLVDAALSRSTTPMQASQAAEFLSHQSDVQRSTAGLVRLVVGRSAEASARAARVLVGSGRPLDLALRELPYDDRQPFADAFYRAYGDQPPLVTALMRFASNNNNIVSWFGRRIARGSVPKAHLWANAFGGEDRLLDLVSPRDKSLALAAVAALVIEAGGGGKQARRITDQMLSKEDISRADLFHLWNDQRRSIYLSKIKRMAGRHELVMHVYEAQSDFVRGRDPDEPDDFFEGGPAITERPDVGKLETTYQLGTVDLQVAGDDITFGTSAISLTVPEQQLAIRFEDPADLRKLSAEGLSKLPLDEMRSGVDLLPHPHRVWRGWAELPDGRTIELEMKPATK